MKLKGYLIILKPTNLNPKLKYLIDLKKNPKVVPMASYLSQEALMRDQLTSGWHKGLEKSDHLSQAKLDKELEIENKG